MNCILLTLMREAFEPKLSKWPFLLGDVLLLSAAYFIVYQSKLPMGPWQILFVVLCIAGGAWLAIMPFLLEYKLLARITEAKGLSTFASQIQNVEKISGQISSATGHWATAQEQAEKTSAGAKSIADRMTAEVQAFTEFMQKANDSEKSTLRLEIEKLRRSEQDWLQVVVRMLDHTYALHQGALRSGQKNVIEQITSFQNACRDSARRLGLQALVPVPGDAFNPQKHQNMEENVTTPADAIIQEAIATGFTYQGRLVRPALVRVAKNESKLSADTNNQSMLSLEAVPSAQG